MNIEFNTNNKTVTIIEMEAKDLYRIIELITDVCGSLDGWNIISKENYTSISSRIHPLNVTTAKDWSGLKTEKDSLSYYLNDTSKSTSTDLTIEMNGKY